MLHDTPGLKVQRNVKLAPLHGDQTRTRDIDVLLTSDVAGYPVRIAFSCKNKRAKIKVGAIGEFIDQLNDVGIPSQQGIFVCVNGFTRDALDRARTAGIRPLVLHGLTKNRLASEVAQAFQFQVSLLAEVKSATVTNTAAVQEYEGQFFQFFDGRNRPCGTLLDLIMAWWQQCEPSITIGEHELNLEVPEGWHQFVDGQPAQLIAMSAVVHVRGLIVTLSGKQKRHLLVNPSESRLERGQIRVEFDISRKKKVKLPLKVVSTETELTEFTLKPGNTKLVTRIKLPRILYHSFYYPLSERVFQLINERFQKFDAGETADPRAFSLEETEGADLSAIWELPWYEGRDADRPPVIVTDDEGNLVDVRLLMKAEEYSRIVALYPIFQRNRIPEFAHYLYWANVILGNQIVTNARSLKSSQAQRLLRSAIERFEQAIQIMPGTPDAHLHMGHALHMVSQHELAVASYDKALHFDVNRYDAWSGRAVALLSLERFEDALASVTKSINLAAEPELQVIPLLMRAYIHLRTDRNSDASNDLIAAWKIGPGELMEDLDHHELMEAICMRSEQPEAILLLSELYCSQAALEAARANRKLAKEKADAAVASLYRLKPRDEADETQVPGSLPGQLVYDALTRCASNLAKSADRGLALEHIEEMQKWAVKIFGEPFDSLTEFISELSQR